MADLGLGARVDHKTFGEGVICGISLQAYRIFFKNYGEKAISKDHASLEILSEGQVVNNNALSMAEVEKALANVLERFEGQTPLIPLGKRWKGGKLIVKPKDNNLQSKEYPVETFFHKIVMLRDRLRVLEQNINSHEVLEDEDKVHLQQYITRCYGTLTSFNILFDLKEHHFKGEGKK